MLALAMIPSSRIVHVWDEDHAYALLRESSPRLTDDARRELAGRLASGRAYLVDERSDAARHCDCDPRLARAWDRIEVESRALRVMPRSSVVSVRDESHALSLLRSSRPDLPEGELREGAWATAAGYALLVIVETFEQLDAWSREEEIDDLAPDGRPPAPIPETREDLTWLSFEVVDDRGRRLEGAYACTIDGRLDDGPLQKQTHAYDDLVESARASLELWAIDLLEVGPLGPVVPVDPIAPDERANDKRDVATTFEVVDPEEHPWLGEYAINQEGVELLRDLLGGCIHVRPDLSAPLTLELRTIRRATLGGT